MFQSLEYIYGQYEGKATMGAIANKGTDNELRAAATFDTPTLSKDDRAKGREALIQELRGQNGS